MGRSIFTDLPETGAQGVVARNSREYLETAFESLHGPRPMVTLRSADDRERIEAAYVDATVDPGGTRGWVDGLHYDVRDDEKLAQVLFTSGTEGASKGILLSHRALSNTADRLIDVMGLDDDVREYVGVPVFYSFGFGRCRSVARVGGRVYLPPEGFNPVELASMLEADAINAISAVPTLWRLVLNRPGPFERFGERVRWIEIGSQFMSAQEKQSLKRLFPRAVIVQHYGLTEASRTTFLQIHDVDEANALASVGRPTGGAEVRIGPESRIEIRGPHLASGLLRDGQAAPLVDPDGWFATSDEGRVDEEGRLHFLGRQDDIINCGGVKISPDSFERRLDHELSQSGVVAVTRVPDDLRGDGLLVAYLTSSGLDASEVREIGSAALEALGVSAGGALHVMGCDSFPVTATGKLRRKALRETFESAGASGAGEERPAFDPPRDEVERFVADRVGWHFGLQDPGLGDSILAAGADSLRTVELVADIDAEFGVELSLAGIYAAPTVLGIADGVRWAIAGHRPEGYKYVVPLGVDPDSELPELFIVGGSYGNVLHLHDLATGLRRVASVYGLQYRGLLEGDEPRESLAETASDFLGEVFEVQPSGPYMLSGYSGGGLIALEMARQLLEAGREVAMLSMIDTRLPARLPYQEPFAFFERQRIRLIASRRDGLGVTDLVRRAAAKATRRFRRRATASDSEEASDWHELSPTKRRSEKINAAFRRACRVYEVPTLPLALHYFRPKDEVTYTLRSGRIDLVDVDIQRVDGAANGWKAFFDTVEVHDVPGGHYTLAHAPNAEHLACVMQGAIESTTGSG